MRAIDALADAMSMDLAVEDESLYVRTALKTLSARGFALVPVVPTAEMLRMGDRANNGDVIAPRQANSQADLIWMIMLAAAQEDGR